MKRYSARLVNMFVALALAASACNIPQGGVPVDVPATPAPNHTSIPLQVDRIGIRTVDGVAEFYHTGTDEKFVPRGVNYVDFYKNQQGNYESRVFATDKYDPERVREAFRHLYEQGYNTVRIFFDTCGSGPVCIGNPNGKGLNPGYLDNLADLMSIAGEEGIYIVYTANSIPGDGGYWQIFDQEFNSTNHNGFIDGRNADWIHSAGVKAKAALWRDLMSGLAERDVVRTLC